MSPHISDLFDLADLAQAVGDGHVRVQVHPSLPLKIINYTERAQYERVWTDVTRQCRGLIVDEHGRVLARPYAKFFNYGEHPEGSLDLAARAVVSDKLDGCFPRGTALNLWGGGTVTIDEVVGGRLPVTLVGMDEHGELVPATVTDWHKNGRKDHWLDIEVGARVSRMSGSAGHPNRLRVTVNHHIWVNGDYRPACETKPGDRVTTQTWRPSDEVIRLVRASLLGDGCILSSATKPGQAKYQESHSAKQADYAEALRKVLGDCAANRSDTRSGYGSHMVWAGSREYEALGDLRREWYPDGVKRVPADLSWMDDYAVAKWLMDDGCRQRFKLQADRICLSTHSFTKEEIERLGHRLTEMYGVSYHLCDDSGRGWTLVVNSGRKQQIQRMWAAITPHVHPSMRYKVPERYRDALYVEPQPGREVAVPREVEVVSVSSVEPNKRNFPSGRTGFDVTTTTHNYMARGVLVHNSLGILYPVNGGHAIATRGSFSSEQALHATGLWQERYAGVTTVEPGITYLFEIIYPGNRIVCDYGDLDDLVLLGGVEIATGMPVQVSWPGPAATVFEYASLGEALKAPPRPGAEGLVVRFPDHGQLMTKIKQSDYVALHRTVTGLNARVVWERLGDGATPAEICEGLPDEFHSWVRDVAAELTGRRDQIVALAWAEHQGIVAALPDGWTRKDYAKAAGRSRNRAWLFLLLDERDPSDRIWRTLRPSSDDRPGNYSEDTA